MRAAQGPEDFDRATPREESSGDDLGDRLAVVDVEALAAGHLQLARIQAELMQDGGVDVGYVVAVLDSVEADLVSGAMYDAALEAAARHPHREAVDVMVAA